MKAEVSFDISSNSFKTTVKELLSNGNDLYLMVLIPTICIITAEMFLFRNDIKTSVWIHVLTLLGLTLSTVFIKDTQRHTILQAFSLLPLLRLVNLSMPIFFELTLYTYIFIYSPLLIPIYVILKNKNYTLEQIGFTKPHLSYLPLAVIIGFIIGFGEYNTIYPGYLIPDLKITNVLKLSLIMILMIGFVEELIFRSILQTSLEKSIGMKSGLLLASFLFGVMHSGYGTAYEILFTASAGLIMGYMFQRTRNLMFISLTHGFVNIFLFGFLPLLLL